MEAEFGGKAHNFFGQVASDLKGVGKKSIEWDLNDWKWDGDLLTAAPLNSLPSDCRNKQLFPVNSYSPYSDEIELGNEKGKRELEKRRRVVAIEDDDFNGGEAGSLGLKLGGQVYPVMEEEEVEKLGGKNGKKTKVAPVTLNRAVCQVEDCRADLSNAKDYHRRHKVCDLHSKATSALVGNIMQRFCQQCSRFHALQEFDEGKRSCRRRLAGHNRRRRKTHPENVVNGGSLNEERGSSYLLISLLRILSNIQSSSSDQQTKDQDLLSHLLKNLASVAGTFNDKNIPGLSHGTHDLQNAGTPVGNAEQVPPWPTGQCATVSTADVAHKRISMEGAKGENVKNSSESTFLFRMKGSVPETTGRTKLNNIDLNNAYDDSEECMGFNLESSNIPENQVNGSLGYPLWLHRDVNKSSPPQTSRNSGSTSTQSPSTSSGETQSRTDRIVFKLFGKDPSDFPFLLRNQILDWLSHSPTEIESYIRPGCIILTIYLRMEKSIWEELCYDLSSSLKRLLDASNDPFWRTGWIYTRVRHRVAFVYNGQVVLDTPLPHKSRKNSRILSVKPIAVSVSDKVQFLVKGVNLSRSTTRMLCALEGKYLVQGSCSEMMRGSEAFIEHDEIQSVSFACSIPNITGRGFIEIEDHGLSSSFFPFIVAEKDVCSEIRTLENAIDVFDEITKKTEIRSQALDFIHEMGWLLHRNQLNSRLGPNPGLLLFPFKRFKWLVEFSIDHGWCAVVKKLLDIGFCGAVDFDGYPSVETALMEVSVLHKAVQRNCKPLVEVLLRYQPESFEQKRKGKFDGGNNIFKPDDVGPGGLTPLHIAASQSGFESVLDALTDDPGSVGIEAWGSARDNTGSTPKDYASSLHHHSYIDLIQNKINKKSRTGHHVILDISGHLKQPDTQIPAKISPFQLAHFGHQPLQRCCKKCQNFGYGSTRTSLAIYRPAMLSMVAIAAVCVCAALLFKSSPEVLYIFRPFRWELLKYGSI